MAQCNLAASYLRGEGVPQDSAEAYAWSSLAAAGGDSDSARNRDLVARSLSPRALREAQARARGLRAEIQARQDRSLAP